MTNSNTPKIKETLEYSNCSVESGVSNIARNFAGNESAGQLKKFAVKNQADTSMCEKTSESMVHSKHLRVKRTLNDLNLMDSFLFSAITEHTQNAEVVARIVVERATGLKLGKVIIETEKQLLGIDTEHRGVRLDLCISELDNEQVAS